MTPYCKWDLLDLFRIAQAEEELREPNLQDYIFSHELHPPALSQVPKIDYIVQGHHALQEASYQKKKIKDNKNVDRDTKKKIKDTMSCWNQHEQHICADSI